MKEMESLNKTSRKVRFTLPEHENNFVSFIKSRNSPAVQVKQKPILPPVPVDESKVHGTSRYVNGTLNFGNEDFKPVVEENKQKIEHKVEQKIPEPKYLRPCIKLPRKSRETKRAIDNETNSTVKSLPIPSSLSKKFHYFIRSRSESRGKKKDLPTRNQKVNTVRRSHIAFYFPGNNLKSECITPSRPSGKQILPKTPDILTVPILLQPMWMETSNILPNFQMLNLNEHSTDTVPMISTKTKQLPHMKNILMENEENVQNFSQFFDRWRLLQYTANRKLLTMQTNRLSNKSSVHKRLGKLSDGKSCNLLTSSYRKRIMNIEKTPLVTSLLRASKIGDKDQLELVIRNIVQYGITESDLNAVDETGRTALSYLCVKSLTSFMDILLRLPGIDVNKADNEGNTPLHFAAEAGHSDALNLLITRSRSLKIDAKNIFGLTPLMKAAVQGRTDCAKRLMLANASPFEMDSGRGLMAEQWARLCGCHFCGDIISELLRHRNVRKTMSCKTPKIEPNLKMPIAARSSLPCKPANVKVDGIASKFRSYLTFRRSKLTSESDLPDLVTNVNLEKDFKSTIVTTRVPKVEVTPANNQSLITKYKTRYSSDKFEIDSEMEALPKVPLRRKSTFY